MWKLIRFELFKIYSRRNIRLFLLALIICNVGLLYMGNKNGQDGVSNQAYRSLCNDLSKMGEQEKYQYLMERREQLDLAKGILMNREDSKTNPFSAEELQNYSEKSYLKYTHDLFDEMSLIDKFCEENETVYHYDVYLKSMREAPDRMGGISIFSGSISPFAGENIIKSAKDHRKLSTKNIRYTPSKFMKISMEHMPTDFLLLLSVFFVAGILITEEKEHSLFWITRVSKRGGFQSIEAKLVAVLIHCLTFSVTLYLINLVFAGLTVGWVDLSAQIQSVSTYMESDLSISLGTYLFLSILTKAVVVWIFAIVLIGIALAAKRSFVMQTVGVAILVINYLLYLFIPSQSSLQMVKYLSLFAVLKTEQLYGGYLNLNIFGQPISWRITAIVSYVLLFCIAWVSVHCLFHNPEHLSMKKQRGTHLFQFRPHNHLLFHEGYKIFVVNKVGMMLCIVVVIFFAIYDSRDYRVTFGEEYYKNIMLQLEGELDAEKEDIIAQEKQRFAEAQNQADKIDKLVESGEISEVTGEIMKMKWENILMLQPIFARVLQQYHHIQTSGGVFVYDTGYNYLFGKKDMSYQIDYLLLVLFAVLAFSNVFPMEQTGESWKLLAATYKGKAQITKYKILCCMIALTVLTIVIWLIRYFCIRRVYPMNDIAGSITNIPQYHTFFSIPIGLFILLKIIGQMIVMFLILWGVLFISSRQKSFLVSVSLSLLVFVFPMILSFVGLEGMKYVSLYPFY